MNEGGGLSQLNREGINKEEQDSIRVDGAGLGPATPPTSRRGALVVATGLEPVTPSM